MNSASLPAGLTWRVAAADLFRLALPLIAVSASRMAMGFIDFVMISQLGEPGSALSTAAQAAISPATLVMWAVMCVGMGALTSVQTFASQADGRGEPERGAAYAWQSLYAAALGLALAWPLGLGVTAFYHWVAAVAQHPADVVALEIQYSEVAVWSIAPAMLAVGFESFFNGVQKPRITLVAVLVSLLVNAFGNYVLIWGHFGFPAMGMGGAALATVIGWWARVAVLAWAFLERTTNARYQTRRSWAFSPAKCREIIWIGGPTSFGWLVDLSSWLVFTNLILPRYGTAAMAANAIALQLTHLAFMPAVGIGMAICSQVGFAIGARREHEVPLRINAALLLTMSYMGAIGLLLIFARRPLLELFTEDPGVVAAGLGIMICVGLYQVFDAMTITYIFALRGAGDTRVPALLNGACCWFIFVGLGWWIATRRPEWGVVGPWGMAVLYLTVLGFLVLWRYRSGAWKRMKVLSDDTPGGPPGPDPGSSTGRPVPAAETARFEAAPVAGS